MNTRRRVKRGYKRLYKKTRKNIILYGGTHTESHSKEAAEVENEAHDEEEGQGGEGESKEEGAQIPESPGIVKPLAYIALGIAEKGTALGVQKLGEILKIDITGKDVGKLLPEFNLSLEDPATRAEFARFLVNITDNVDFALKAMGPPIRKVVDKILDIADESGKKVVRTAAGVALEGATAIPVVGSGIGAFIVADNFVKLIQSAMSAFFGATNSSMVAVAEVNQNIKNLQQEKEEAQERISDATSGFNSSVNSGDGDGDSDEILKDTAPSLKDTAKELGGKHLSGILEKTSSLKDMAKGLGGNRVTEIVAKAKELASTDIMGILQRTKTQFDELKSSLPTNLTPDQIKAKLLEKSTSIVNDLPKEVKDMLEKIIDKIYKPSMLEKMGFKKKTLAEKLTNAVNGMDIDKIVSLGAIIARETSNLAFKFAESLTNDLPFSERMTAKAALKTAALATSTAISTSAYAGKHIAKHVYNSNISNNATAGGSRRKKKHNITYKKHQPKFSNNIARNN